MPDALDLLETITSVDFGQLAADTLEENREVAADLNAQQLSMGLRADGTFIQPPYAPLTIELKKDKTGLASVTDRVTLYDTGSHYRELYMDVQGDVLEFGSKDKKSADLEKKYGTAKGSLYGLTEENQEELVEQHLRGSYLNKIGEQLGLD